MKRTLIATIAALTLGLSSLFAQTDLTSPTPAASAEQQRIFAERMREMNERLDRLVSEMNAAGPDRKQDAIASVVNELVAQRKALQDQIEQLRSQESR